MFCHAIVRQRVASAGGQQCFGWLYSVPSREAAAGAHGFTFHSVWRAPDGRLVDVSPHAFSRNGWSVFIPDARRRYDFIQEQGYNAVVVYLDERHAAHARQLSGLPVRPGVLYWTSHLYLLPVDAYAGLFRRASCHQPEIVARYGLRVEDGHWRGLETLSRSQRIELAFNYGLA